MLNWLPDPNTQEDTHADIRKATINGKLKDPGKWITELDDFKEWQNSRDSCSIWLRGDLGTGKTVLTSTVVNHLSGLYKGTTNGAMAYYYCSGAANAKPNASDILRSILRQLVATDAGFDAYQDWKTGQERRDLTNEATTKLIGDMVKLSTSQTTIIIDALDETDKDSCRHVIDVLEDLINLDGGLVKVFIASRGEEHIRRELDSWPTIILQSKLTEEDIDKYINAEVDHSLRLRKEEREKEGPLREEVKSFLKRVADGMYVE